MSSGVTDVHFFQHVCFLKRQRDRPCLICPDRGLLGNLKFTAKNQQISNFKEPRYFYALNEPSTYSLCKDRYFCHLSANTMRSGYLCVRLSIISTQCFSFERSPLVMKALIDLHTGDSDEGVITGVCLDTTRLAYLHSCEV